MQSEYSGISEDRTLGTVPFVLCKEVVLFGRSKRYRNYREELFWDLKLCPL
jgi:hypothetical protein